MKWIGYILASILILSVIVGSGMFIAIVVAIIGASFCLVVLVGFIAYLIQQAVEPSSGPRDS